MTNILIHGLGQNESSWDLVKGELEKKNIKVEVPNLFTLIKDNSSDYTTLFHEFTDYCNQFDGKVNLCGLSLGGILALQYAKEFPNKVHSLILIATPYQIPKFLFKIQNLIFCFMPKRIFNKMGVLKSDFISLVNSMSNLEIAEDLDKIKCKSLILCGIKDKSNLESSKLLNEHISNSVFKTVSNSSHEVNVDQPIELSDSIYQFWRK